MDSKSPGRSLRLRLSDAMSYAPPMVRQSSCQEIGRRRAGAACGGYHPSSGSPKQCASAATLLGVARDVGCGEQRVFQQRRIEVRFVLPDVERPAETAPEQGLAVDHLPARGVYEDGAGFHQAEQPAVGHVARRSVERRVEGEDVGLAGHLLQRPESAPLALLARRVAADDAESPPFGIRFHERSDVSHAHDSQRALGGLPALRAGEVDERRADPLQYAPGVAARGRRDFDAVRRAPRRVDVVEADGRRGDQLYARIRQ